MDHETTITLSRLIEPDISKAMKYAKEVQKTNPPKFQYARQILLTHLPLHENIIQTVKSIISEYSLDCNTGMLFIGVAEIMNQKEGI